MAWSIIGDNTNVPYERKTEILFSGLSILVPNGTTGINLINALKLITPTYGTFAPFLNTTSNKLNAYNADEQMTVKVNVRGTFPGGSTNRTVAIAFLGTEGNTCVQNRPIAAETEVFSFSLPIMISKNGNIVTNGTAIQIYCGGGDFTINKCLIAVTQRVKQGVPLAVV